MSEASDIQKREAHVDVSARGSRRNCVAERERERYQIK